MKNKLRMQNIMVGPCSHEIKVTALGNGKYGCRTFLNGELNQEIVVDNKKDINSACRSMLRMEDKCGNQSQQASSSRHRNKPR